MKRLGIAIIVIMGICSPADTFEDTVLLWPIDRPAMITGTFGEYRGPHFHHGIDVSTGGRTGFAVYAADDGRVTSVMYQQWGIGYAVIITHRNGWKTLYGHLERFDDSILNNDAIKGYIPNIENRKDFRVDFSLSGIPVKKGAVIGYSGESGIGLEHFHFEVRRSDGEPVNPLINGLKVQDHTAPVMTAVSLMPLDKSSQVDGSSEGKRYSVIQTGKNTGTIKAKNTITISGNVGFTVNAYDRIGIRNGVAPYGFDLYEDNRLLYQIRYRRIERSLSHRIGLYYDTDSSSLSSYTMYLYDRTTGKGAVKAGGGEKTVEIRIVCFDAADNSSTLIFHLKPEKRAAAPAGEQNNLRKGRSLELISADKNCTVTFPAASALYDEHVTMEMEGPPRISLPGMASRSGVYSLSPTNLCMDKAAELAISYGGDDFRKIGVYRFSRNGRYFSLVGSRYDAGKKAFCIPVWRMGKFFLARDDTPPRIRFRNGMKVSAGDKLRLYVGDSGSGADLATAVIQVDGRDAAWDYDPDRHCIEILRHNQIWAKGKHEIAARISDGAGNRSAQEVFRYIVR